VANGVACLSVSAHPSVAGGATSASGIVSWSVVRGAQGTGTGTVPQFNRSSGLNVRDSGSGDSAADLSE
jgi:hypothetical protein